MNPKAEAQKNSDGSYTVRVFHTPESSSDVVFPYNPHTSNLAVEYANFKNSQNESGPKSPATRAVVRDLKGMLSNDKHEQLMDAAKLEKFEAPTASAAFLDHTYGESSEQLKQYEVPEEHKGVLKSVNLEGEEVLTGQASISDEEIADFQSKIIPESSIVATMLDKDEADQEAEIAAQKTIASSTESVSSKPADSQVKPKGKPGPKPKAKPEASI